TTKIDKYTINNNNVSPEKHGMCILNQHGNQILAQLRNALTLEASGTTPDPITTDQWEEGVRHLREVFYKDKNQNPTSIPVTDLVVIGNNIQQNITFNPMLINLIKQISNRIFQYANSLSPGQATSSNNNKIVFTYELKE